MITGTGSAATLRAESASTLAVLNHSSFRRKVLSDPDLSYALMQTMARSIFRLVRELEYTTFESVPQRLARTLSALVSSQGIASSEGIQILHAPTHQDLANLVGASRETVTRTLAKMQADGLLKIGYRRLTILDADGLAKITEGSKDK
jgi:CRP-like cAMP-binding protein